MYEEIIKEIKSNLGENNELNRRYLTGQLDVYRDHPYSIEITREISRMIWDCLSQDEKEEFIEISEKENPLMDILNEISPNIEHGEYKTALEKLDSFIENYRPMFEDDSVSEYHFLQILLKKYCSMNMSKPKKASDTYLTISLYLTCIIFMDFCFWKTNSWTSLKST